MIIVTGATGRYGRKVVESLVSRMPASEVGVSVRDPEKAAYLQGLGVRVSRGDFKNPSSLAASFDGADQVLIVSANVLGEEAIRLHGSAIQAAKAAGAKRILYTSHQAASASSKVAFARDHAATEALLGSSGLPFVSLRNGFYAESAFYQLGGMVESGKLRLPEDGPVSWTVRNDLAEAAAIALSDTSLFDGITAPLTGSTTYTFADVARIASEVLGREIDHETVSGEDYRQGALSHGYPELMVDMLVTMFQAIQDGEFDVVDPTLEKVLGRRPMSMDQVLAPFLTNDGR